MLCAAFGNLEIFKFELIFIDSLDDKKFAIKFLKKSLNSENLDDIIVSAIFNNISAIYLAIKDYEKTLKYSKKSIYIIEPEVIHLYILKYIQIGFYDN